MNWQKYETLTDEELTAFHHVMTQYERDTIEREMMDEHNEKRKCLSLNQDKWKHISMNYRI